MRIIVTGANGFIGRKLVAALLQAGSLPGPDGTPVPLSDVRLFDVVAPEVPAALANGTVPVRSIAGDLSDPAALDRLMTGGADVVFHLAAVVSAQAEEDFGLGMRVNFDATRALLDATRTAAPDGAARLVFTSSVAVFGGDLPHVVRDDTAPVPQSSYGVQKAMSELLVQDYARRGFVDGRTVRLPTIVVRPGPPNKAASTFASSIIREPLNGESAICPVPEDTGLFVASPRCIVANLLHAASVPAARFGHGRTVMLPGLSVTVAEMIEALRAEAGAEAVARIRFEDDARIRAIVASWPARFQTDRAAALGFQADASFAAIVRAFVEDEMGVPNQE
ncbi:SDR family oxidoreductase [Roseospira marina]|uniref:SDR family oxidoreductase n=1 Tax=Roseospira marina TaxID=140057 RepID=A0A5M6IB59_9PROT|nr:D-erythronate dehydrogenase [Roseospira marina]KAA5605471.1 SDR family oxidoreductase [Roseospira marina]MBB4314527.1 nucleoside-diphosphate-sugar epimerase [Roseospira marina]MBB5088645.1 nucleoside-diphosphate-sugar epimerase [Roseospira marina]